ncbi:hypothetical protein MTDSW087_01238 [Methylobacterium dankookense]|uniref:Uncharacterized protein n=1 Tax=Methylobacterium dankookense TaxID=560405 RepID=A0A564FUX5_9HYPH|nr:hypothetical protein IFDJLNFL_4727 [Methylobacterium dankookense]VUF11556.1 hypothetical protein MTDSW087_01238 [Methylobacterium dankookense]
MARMSPRAVPVGIPTSLAVALGSALTLGAAVSAVPEGWWAPAPAPVLLQPRPAGPQVDATGNRYRTRADW